MHLLQADGPVSGNGADAHKGAPAVATAVVATAGIGVLLLVGAAMLVLVVHRSYMSLRRQQQQPAEADEGNQSVAAV